MEKKNSPFVHELGNSGCFDSTGSLQSFVNEADIITLYAW